MSRIRFLFSPQNVEKRANALAYEDRTHLRTLSKVSKIQIQPLGGLILSGIKVFCL